MLVLLSVSSVERVDRAAKRDIHFAQTHRALRALCVWAKTPTVSGESASSRWHKKSNVWSEFAKDPGKKRTEDLQIYSSFANRNLLALHFNLLLSYAMHERTIELLQRVRDNSVRYDAAIEKMY